MSEEDNRRILEGLWGQGPIALSAEAEYELRAEDFVMEMPQSGERVVGRDKMRAMQEAYLSPPAARVRRMVGSGDLFVVELVSDYPGVGTYYVANIVEFKDGKIARETRYYGQPFEAPEWRARWVERM